MEFVEGDECTYSKILRLDEFGAFLPVNWNGESSIWTLPSFDEEVRWKKQPVQKAGISSEVYSVGFAPSTDTLVFYESEQIHWYQLTRR